MSAVRIRLLAGLLAGLACAACGNKGPLFLPADGTEAAAPAATAESGAQPAPGEATEATATRAPGPEDDDADRAHGP